MNANHVSLNYGELLKRQEALEKAGGFGKLSYWQVQTALLAEYGELLQELKPLWVFWKRKDQIDDIDSQKVLEEAADVLHFLLLLDLLEFSELPSLREPAARKNIEPDPCTIDTMTRSIGSSYRTGYEKICLLMGLLESLGFGDTQLIEAYYTKTELNLQRWCE